MHNMVTRNRGRKASMDIDNEALPVLVANEDVELGKEYLCAGSVRKEIVFV